MNLSVVIVSYNTRGVLQNCLDSVFDTIKDELSVEVTVVDNASDDGSVQIVRSRFPQVAVIQNSRNVGFGAANNQAIKTAKDEYVLLLNPDTIVLDRAIQKTVHFMEQHPEADIVGCKLLNLDGSLQPSCRSFPSIANCFFETLFLYKLFPKNKVIGRYHMTCFSYNKVAEVDMVAGSFMMIKRAVFQYVGGFDEDFFLYSEETDLCLRAKRQGYNVLFFPHASVIHLGGQSSVENRAQMFGKIHRGKLQFYKKHFSGYQFLVMAFLQYAAVVVRVFVYFFGGVLLLNGTLLKKSWHYLLSLMD